MTPEIRKLKDLKADIEHFGFIHLYEHNVYESDNAGPFNQVALAAKHLARAIELMIENEVTI